jgi:urease accessory protein
MSDLLVWQILDSAYPTGGFAHSMGLEAASQIAFINSGTLCSFIKQTLVNQCTSSLPFVRGKMNTCQLMIYSIASHLGQDIEYLEKLIDAMMIHEVTRRGSVAQVIIYCI